MEKGKIVTVGEPIPVYSVQYFYVDVKPANKLTKLLMWLRLVKFEVSGKVRGTIHDLS